ncbi:MAG TPA: ribonuclease III [Acidimicrobiia bacterium]|jgi:ribonuclease-3|nr:ribonuclease III [Acidimicrobiia bacterium]
MSTPPVLSDLEDALGYRFRDPDILEAALVHRSYQAEHPAVADNERFEFLGDAVLGLAITAFIYDEYPAMSEGQMAKVRAAAVSRDDLATIATAIGLAPHLRLGRGEEVTGGRAKASILADTLEAVIGAAYLDGGYEAAASCVARLWEQAVRNRARRPGGADHKTRLQEILAATGLAPVYRIEASGPDHRKVFHAEVMVGGRLRGQGSGGSKREAEQEAARAALAVLTADPFSEGQSDGVNG